MLPSDVKCNKIQESSNPKMEATCNYIHFSSSFKPRHDGGELIAAYYVTSFNINHISTLICPGFLTIWSSTIVELIDIIIY